MSTSDSDSEVFYDAVDYGGETLARKLNPPYKLEPDEEKREDPTAPKSESFRQRRQELKKLREALQESEFDDEVPSVPRHPETSSLSSTSSSIGGASGVQRVPFRIIEDDSISHRTTASLGILTRAQNPLAGAGVRQLSNSSGSLSVSKPSWAQGSEASGAVANVAEPKAVYGQEPDLVACSKRPEEPISPESLPENPSVHVTSATPSQPDDFVIQSRQVPLPSASSTGSGPEAPDYLPPPPVPPPRKKRGRNKAASTGQPTLSTSSPAVVGAAATPIVVCSTPSSDVFTPPLPPGLPPACTPEKSPFATLDLESAVQGLSLVRTSDDEASRGGRGGIVTSSSQPSADSTFCKSAMSGSDTLSSVQSEGGASKYYSFSDSTSSSSKRASLKSQRSGGKSTSGSKDSGSNNNSKSSTLDSKRSTLDSVLNGSLDRRRKSSNLPDGEEEGVLRIGGITIPLSLKGSSSGKSSLDRDSDIMKQVNNLVRTRTPSGRLLSDAEILDQVTVLNLDTGERVPLSEAEQKLPPAINPLMLHMMRLTSEYVSPADSKSKDSDDESIFTHKSLTSESGEASTVKRKTQQLKKFLGRTAEKAVHKAKGLAHAASNSAKGHKHSSAMSVASGSGAQSVSGAMSLSGGATGCGGPGTVSGTGVGSSTGLESEVPDGELAEEPVGQSRIGEIMKMRAASKHKGPYDFDNLKYVQCLRSDNSSSLSTISGPIIWAAKFSPCGRLLATASREFITIWVLSSAYAYFADMRTKYNAKTSPSPSQENLDSEARDCGDGAEASVHSAAKSVDPNAPFCPTSFCTYIAHTAVVLDLNWSKNYFLLSCSMDRTVRLWHISRAECLCVFQHVEVVTSICFHPRDDRYFLSGSLDGKLRLWNIPDKKVALWNEVEGPTKLITAANFVQNGKFAAVGTYDGRVIFYTTEQFRYHTQIHIRASSNSSKKYKSALGSKVTGILPCQGDKILVSTTDSRIRMYDLRDLSLSCKYKGKGFLVRHNHIKADMSHDGKYIVTGTDNALVYFWKTHHDFSKFSSARRDRNIYYESIRAMSSGVTLATFSPNPQIVFLQMERDRLHAEDPSHRPPEPTDVPTGYVLVTAENSGYMRVFVAKAKAKHSSLPASAWPDN